MKLKVGLQGKFKFNSKTNNNPNTSDQTNPLLEGENLLQVSANREIIGSSHVSSNLIQDIVKNPDGTQNYEHSPLITEEKPEPKKGKI
jgi:hypothetical protein